MEGGNVSGNVNVNGEASPVEWRSNIHPEARRCIVEKLVEALKKCCQSSTSGSSIDFEGNAARYEETLYRNAISEDDYLWSLSLKILEWEDHSENWRQQLHCEARKRIVRRITQTLRRSLQSVPESELEKVAMRFEEKIYCVASSKQDYLRKISMKMLCMEQRARGSSGVVA